MDYICTLDSENECEFLQKNQSHCKGNKSCAFCVEDGAINKRVAYERRLRWYAK